jgi:hypothetical protein
MPKKHPPRTRKAAPPVVPDSSPQTLDQWRCAYFAARKDAEDAAFRADTNERLLREGLRAGEARVASLVNAAKAWRLTIDGEASIAGTVKADLVAAVDGLTKAAMR